MPVPEAQEQILGGRVAGGDEHRDVSRCEHPKQAAVENESRSEVDHDVAVEIRHRANREEDALATKRIAG